MTPESARRSAGWSISARLAWPRALNGRAEGQSVTEYALFLGLPTLAVIGAMTLMSDGISTMLSTLGARIASSVS